MTRTVLGKSVSPCRRRPNHLEQDASTLLFRLCKVRGKICVLSASKTSPRSSEIVFGELFLKSSLAQSKINPEFSCWASTGGH